MKTVAFCGGGTGGHVFPIKSLVEYIYDNEEIYGQIKEIFWIGEKDSLEKTISQSLKFTNLKFISIYSGKFRRDISFKSFILNFRDLFLIIIGLFQSILIIKNNNINVIFCKGGYVALPFILAGKLLNKKILIHESDTVPGIVNKIGSKFSKYIFTGFPNVFKNSTFVGQIISKDILDYSFNDLQINDIDYKNKTNILLIGGSQGAKVLYESVIDIFSNNNSLLSNINLFVVLGLKNKDLHNQFSVFKNVYLFNFLNQKQMGLLMSISDIGITRGGATSLAEQKLFGLKLFIVPLPYTGGNHQYYNALYYVKTYNDFLINQDNDLTTNLFISLKNNIGYKKNISITKDINVTKQIIIDKIFE